MMLFDFQGLRSLIVSVVSPEPTLEGRFGEDEKPHGGEVRYLRWHQLPDHLGVSDTGNLQNCQKIIHHCFFKPLNLGVIYYTTIEN